MKEELWNGLKKALEGAFTQFVETRITEGENLKKDILAKLTFLEQEVAAVEERSHRLWQNTDRSWKRKWLSCWQIHRWKKIAWQQK